MTLDLPALPGSRGHVPRLASSAPGGGNGESPSGRGCSIARGPRGTSLVSGGDAASGIPLHDGEMYVIFPAQELIELYTHTATGYPPMSMAREYHLHHLKNSTFNGQLKLHNTFSLNLVKIVADFTQQLATIHEQQAEDLQGLVETFRKRNAELRRERPLYQSTLFASWETFLQEVEVDSQIHSDIAGKLGRQVSVPLLEKTFHQKVQSRKVFTHRESYETILSKTEELLLKCHNDYSAAYQRLLSDQSGTNMAAYYDTHNAYVQQLHAANSMIDAYHSQVLPQLLEELEDVYLQLSDTVAKSILEGAEVISQKASEQHTRYDALVTLSKNVSPKSDITNYIRTLGIEKAPTENNQHLFTSPQLESDITEIPDLQYIPRLGDEVMVDRNTLPSMRASYDGLKKEKSELDLKIHQLQEALESLVRLQQRSLENCLFNKANELQEDISLKRFDHRMAQIHLAAVKEQIDLLASKVDDKVENNSRDRKSSNGSTKIKWLKAFKSLKTGGGDSAKKNDKKDSKDAGKSDASPPTLENAHIFQEYTYKKITGCDICREILRGHSRQGLRCKMCKTNVHADCKDKVGKCNPKPRLLRRQKSTSEIESRVVEADEDKPEKIDPVYQLLKQAGDLSSKKTSTGSMDSSGSSLGSLHKRSARSSNSLTVSSHLPSSSISAPHSPQRQKLNLRMKSLSLDSPESNEHVQRRHHQSHSSSHSQSPQSPVHSRRLLNAKTVRMSSVDLPDDNEKSLSSASTSPCPSPKPHRLLPTNLYVVLYNFKARQGDELDLKAGYTVTVIDTTDSDWWKGKCLGRIGYFPSKYVTKLNPGERPLQVTHNLQVTDGENGLKLLREQIVIQIGEELEGMVPVRSGDKQGMCPLRYLQEV